jgi:hypothetical protein
MNYDYNYDYATPAQTQAAIDGRIGAIFLVVMLTWLLVVAAIYIYYAICLMKIAKKTGTANGWFAWIPILNLILMIQVAKKPMWWILMFLIPFVNIIFSIIVWMAVAEAVKKPSWWGIMVIVPIMNLVMPGYLAFSKMEEVPASSIIPSVQPPVQPAV